MTLILILLLSVPVFADDTARDVRLIAVSGEVTVYQAGATEGTAASADLPLDDGDRVVTGPGSAAELGLDDGSVVSLDERTDFTLRSEKRSDTVLEILTGGLVAKIKKLTAVEGLRIKSPTAVASVRGTELGVEVVEKGETHVGVFDEGRVEVSGDAGEKQTLSPNQETRVIRGGSPARPAALKRFLKRRAFVRGRLRQRTGWLAQHWKKLSPDKRKELRQKLLERREQREERSRERRERQRGRGGREGRPGPRNNMP